MARSFPEIPARGLAGLGVELPGLAGIRIALTGGRGTAKFHVPPPDPGLRHFHHDACRYSKPADQASTYGLLEVFERICKKCPIVLPAAADALWRAVAFAAGRREVLDRAEAEREPRTWLGYARAAAQHDPGDDELVDQWLRQARADTALAKDADTLADAWDRLNSAHRSFLDRYAAECPEVEAYNGARDAVRRSVGSEQRRVLDQVSAAVGKVSRTRQRTYGPPPELDAGALVCGVWLAARSRGHSARRAAELAHSAAGTELVGTQVVDVTRLPVPPRTDGSAYETPAAWANEELQQWWRSAVADMCTRLEADFEAESADAASRLLLVRDWPLTGTRDAPVAYLAASPVLGPVVPYGYRQVDDYVSWSGGDSAGPSFGAVLAAPAHLVAKIEKEQAAQPSHQQARFTAGGPITGGGADMEAAQELLRTVFPMLPGDGDGEPPLPAAAVAEQRAARHAARGQRLAGEEQQQLYRIADSIGGGYACWVPGDPEELEPFARLVSWLRWSTVRVDMLSGPSGAADRWVSVFGTLEPATTTHLGISPGGRHRTVRIPWHRIVAVTGVPRYDRGYGTPDLWQPYEPVDAPPPPPPGPRPSLIRGGGLRAVPSPDGAA
ncbi:hypothetical protein [Streptomyces anthocyanicus]|uniref:hypothetical protein n=1 Tax=Streptomyces anthocyanicus TaxID=68174 RepID=UPI003807170D